MIVMARLLGTDIQTVIGRTIKKISSECSLASKLLSDNLEITGFFTEDVDKLKSFSVYGGHCSLLDGKVFSS